MAIIFKQDNHSYLSSDQDQIDWVSVTSFVNKFKPKFDSVSKAKEVSKKKRSKWYGLTPEKIQEVWSNESKRASELGTWYHSQREKDLSFCNTIERLGQTLQIVNPIYTLDGKIAPEQKLQNNYMYPEHLVYLKSVGVCGQADLVEVIDGHVHITDYKTNKELKTEGFKSWDGKVDTMLPPVAHLDNCHLNHYTLQLSLYLYIILKHNYEFKPGNLTIQHVLFEEEARDEYDNPITKRDDEGSPIVKDIVNYRIPYLKTEVVSMLKTLRYG
jgi:ATP-dependent exoDNAse (exonuclease V) beta subunit